MSADRDEMVERIRAEDARGRIEYHFQQLKAGIERALSPRPKQDKGNLSG